MYCHNCGVEVDVNSKKCPSCNTVLITTEDQIEATLPQKYKPLKPITYLGLLSLFSLPMVGLIFAVVFSVNDNNINRRNFARMHLYSLAVALILLIVLLLAGGVGILNAIADGTIDISKFIEPFEYIFSLLE